ncbi:hypothetical protein ACFYM2_21430 [Streptomyces sp. NPDC006711]|uniref:hypothetical protein n=1 Tax=Streptomyces sp. NPDC006711 TaxID=3364762 RepID=UPI00369D5EB9
MSAREELFRRVAGAFVDEGRANTLLDAYRAEVRAEAAADVRRAELPSFPAGERAELVAQTMRAIDARIAEHGAEAPYGVAVERLVVLEPCPRNVVGDDAGPHFFKNGAFLADGRRCVYCGAKER